MPTRTSLACIAIVALAGAAFAVPGTFYTEDASVQGELTSATIPMSTAACTDTQINACWVGCDNQITNPFCAVVSANCEPTTAGGMDCHCWYFCASQGGGSTQHKPKEAWRSPEMAVREEN